MSNLKLYQLEDMTEAGAIKQFTETKRNIYYISKFGNIYSQSKNNLKRIKQRKLSPDGEGYLMTVIGKKGYRAHVLVAEMFDRPRKPKEVINHIDGNKTNNNIENLEVTTQSLNSKHAWAIKKERRRLTPEKAEQIRKLHSCGYSSYELARQFNCTSTSIYQVVNNITFKTKK
ncbi:HNH endonuclease [Staphylococcus pseudintermedius]|nr:HNH endonuclease [Staphylococcus pseudintermedius]